MELKLARQALLECRAFEGLSRKDLGHLLLIADSDGYEAGAVVFKQGDRKTSSFYLIAEGSVDIIAEESGDKVNECERGDILGEMGQVNPKGVRTKTVKAQTDVKFLVWDFQQIVKESEELSKKIIDRCEQLAFERISQDL